MTDRVDVLLVVARPADFAAARSVAGARLSAPWQQRDAGSVAPYLWGSYRATDGRHLSVALARPTHDGGRAGGPIASTLAERLRPACVAMCGVCSGSPADTALGDVIVADPVYGWDEGAWSATGFAGDHRQHRLDPVLARAAQDLDPAGLPSHGAAGLDECRAWLLERLHHGQDPRSHPARRRYFPDSTWAERLALFESEGLIGRDQTGGVTLTDAGATWVLRRLYDDVDGPRRLPFRVLVAPMASGGARIADGTAWPVLRATGMRGIAAVEQEAATIASIAHEAGVPYWLVAKGVTDHAGAEPDDRHRAFAATASAEVLFAVLEAVDLSRPAGRPRPSPFPTTYEPARRVPRPRDDVGRHRARWRANFARHLLNRLHELANKEDWTDARYAELEAEIEMEGRARAWLPGPRHTQTLRREESLSDALERSRERLILLEGEPGSGKSVALRHVATRMAAQIHERPTSPAPLPLYVNLKAFSPPTRPITDAAVREYVVSVLNPERNSDADAFLEQEFARGMTEGAWLFLFDSFDEIPDVLGSTEADVAVEEYGVALRDFLAMSNCRGVIASREFRGPRQLGWPRFRILRLSERRRRALVDRSMLSPHGVETLHSGLQKTAPALRALSESPLFLSLLCSYIRETGRFPDNPYLVFERFVGSRLDRDRHRVERLYEITPDGMRHVAEEIAYEMATGGLGLQPDREALRARVGPATARSGVDAGVGMGALVYAKLAAEEPDPSGATRFSFSHRRMQEYFATCALLRDPDRVTTERLLTDQNWREAAVTILQTQDRDTCAPILDALDRRLAAAARRVDADPDRFAWPARTLHHLSLLDAGVGARTTWVSASTRQAVATVLRAAWKHGRRHDRGWAVESVCLAPPDDMLSLLAEAFQSPSSYLRAEAYRQVGRLESTPPELAVHLRRGLLTQLAEGQLRSRLATLRTQIRRLPDPRDTLRALTLVRALPVVDALLSLVIGVFAVTFGVRFGPKLGLPEALPLNWIIGVTAVVAMRATLVVMIHSPEVSWATPSAGVRMVSRLSDALSVFAGGLALRLKTPFTRTIVVRLLVVLVIFAATAPQVGDPRLGVVSTGLLGYAVLWSPVVMWIAISGWPVGRAQWLALPPVGMVRTAFGRGLMGNWPKALGQVSAILAMSAAGMVIHRFEMRLLADRGIIASNDFGSPDYLRLTPTGVLAASVVAGVVLALALIGLVAWTSAERRLERRVLAEVGRLPAAPTAETMAEIVVRAGSDRMFREVVRALRQAGALSKHPSAVRFLSDVAAAAERSTDRLRVADGSSAEFVAWFAAAKSNRWFVGSLSEPTIDEIAALVADARR